MNKSFNKPAKMFETHNFIYGHIMQSNILSDDIYWIIYPLNIILNLHVVVVVYNTMKIHKNENRTCDKQNQYMQQ
jgi:hypothetical protein